MNRFISHSHVQARAALRRGQSLVELVIVALAAYLLLAAILTFGHVLFVAQASQQAIDLAAREVSRAPLPADDAIRLDDVLRGNANTAPQLADIRQRVYDEHYLVLNLETLHGRASLRELIADLPVVNQQLVSLMISDQVGGVRVLRYPGAVFSDTDASDDPVDPPASGYLVAIPLVVGRNSEGVETIDWIPVIEEIESQSNPDPFLLSSPARGLVALRLNYPYQAAAMSSFAERAPGDSRLGRANVADDGGVSVVDHDGYSPMGATRVSDRAYGPYAGPFGLGQQAVLGKSVRPYRRLISTQAVYRREVFLAPQP